MGLYHGSGAPVETGATGFCGGSGAIEEMSPVERHSRADKVGNFLAFASFSPSASLWPNPASSP